MDETITHYLNQLRKTRSEDAFFALLHIEDSYVPTLIEAYQQESDPTVQAILVEIIWQHRSVNTFDFLAKALQHNHQQVWKNALDGVVAIGGDQALELLKTEKERLIALLPSSHDHLEWIEEAIDQIKQNMV